MCRLAGFVFSTQTPLGARRELISRFKSLSEVGTVPQGIEPGHPDGWGVVMYDPDREVPWRYLSESPAHLDENDSYKDICKPDIVQSGIMHVRKKTAGETALRNTHPFTKERISFAHNGTVTRDTATMRFADHCGGETDSERVFAQIHSNLEKGKDSLTAYREALQEVVQTYPGYSALNTLFHDGAVLYASRIVNTKHSEYTNLNLEAYYTLYIARGPQGEIVICSEPFFPKGDWKYEAIENNSLVATDCTLGTITNIPF